jgi:hydrocephalus-inducing protein
VDVDVVLKARGVGSTLFCKEDLTDIPFGTLYTHSKRTKEIFVENKGRKA